MEHITTADLVRAADGILLQGDPNREIRHITIDSREVTEDSLFVPLPGEHTDGHRFIADAIKNGAAASLVAAGHTPCAATEGDAAMILVRDSASALLSIGNLIRSRLLLPVIAVTGSVGKTTTRELTALALSAGKKVFRTGRNYNNKIGLPLTLSEISSSDEIAVLELGMNVPGELSDLAKLARPDCAAVTNIGIAHMEYYGSKEAICKEKMTITDGLSEDGVLFLNGDDPLLLAEGKKSPHPVIFYGENPENDYRAEQIRNGADGLSFDLVHGAVCIPVKLSVPGLHNVRNALCALAIADHYQVPLASAAKALSSFGGFAHRLEKKETGMFTILDDTYNASPDSMKAGLDVLAKENCSGKRVAVLGDMLELGDQSLFYHYEVGQFAAKEDLGLLIGVGDEAKEILRGAKDAGAAYPMVYFSSEKEAEEELPSLLQPHDLVYFKASHAMNFEELIDLFVKR